MATAAAPRSSSAQIGGDDLGQTNELGGLLRALRTARQMSLGQTAQRAGLSKGTLSNWEAGRFQPRLPELSAVLAALEASEERARACPGERAARPAKPARAGTG